MTAEPGERNILEAAEKHYLAGRLDQAEGFVRRVLKRPDAPPNALSLLSKILIEGGKPQQAAFELERALRARPDDVELTMMLHNAYSASGQEDKALAIAEKAAAAHPRNDEIACAVAFLHMNKGRIGESERWYKKALAINPESLRSLIGLSRVMSSSFRTAESVAVLKDAIKQDVRSAGIFRVLAFQMQYASGVDQAEAFEFRKLGGQLGAREVDGYPPRLQVDADPDRKLTIGYLSPDFRQHACAHFIEPLLAARDRGAFRIIAYSSTFPKDDFTKRLRAQVDVWRDVVPMKEAAISGLIAEDRVDIAIDLAGHTSGTRLTSLVLRPAPITINYMGFAATTGVPGVDFRIVDSVTDPEGAEKFATERLVRLDPCFLCFRPLPESPEVSESPCVKNGHITFGSFNVIDKVSEATLDAWVRVLKAVPGSRMFLKSRSLADEYARERARAEFAARGVDASRLDLVGWTGSLREHLDLYARVDIALDTFPYNGTTTTCEAMWMGVPVVTVRGDVHAARVGVSLLSAMGLPELIAPDMDGFVHTAAALAADRDRIVSLRQGMRTRMANSPLRDEQGFMRRFEAALRGLWREWCAARPR